MTVATAMRRKTLVASSGRVMPSGPLGNRRWGVGDVVLTRRAFIRSSAALSAVGSLGGFSLLGCHGGAHQRAPESIDNTGATDVSQPLTNWLASTGAPGDVFELRRRPDGSPAATGCHAA